MRARASQKADSPLSYRGRDPGIRHNTTSGKARARFHGTSLSNGEEPFAATLAMKRASRIRCHKRSRYDCIPSEDCLHDLHSFALSKMRELCHEPINRIADYYCGSHAEGCLEFDSMTRMAGCSRTLPDCVQYVLAKGPKFVIRHRKVPSSLSFSRAMNEFKRRVFCAIHFADVPLH